MKRRQYARECAAVGAAIVSALVLGPAQAWSDDSAPSVFQGSVSGGAQASTLNGGSASVGGMASLRLEEGRAGVVSKTSCDYGGFVVGLFTLGMGGMGSGCRDYRAEAFHDVNLDFSAGWDAGFIGKLHGGVAFYGFDTTHLGQHFPIVDLGVSAFDADRMRLIYASPEAGLRLGADAPGDRHHLSLLASVGGYGDQIHGRGGYLLTSAILRGELNVTKSVLLRGQAQAGMLTGGSADPATSSTSESNTSDGTTTTTQTSLAAPGFVQNGVGSYESVACTVQVNLPKNIYAAVNFMDEWQQLQTTDVGLNNARGATHDDSAHVMSGTVDLGVHFKK